jgi:Undecaprenyl-phosphate glucose phosphotransferase
VVGGGDLGLKFAHRINENPYVGYNIIGFLDDNLEIGYKILDSEVIGKINHLEQIILNNHLDKVIITISPTENNIWDIVDLCEKHGVKAVIIPEFSRYFPARPNIDMLDDIPIIDVRYVPLDNLYKKFLKRVFDFIAAGMAIIILSPVILITALIVKLSSPGSVIYKQERVGLNRKNFQIYKFRSMKEEGNEETPQWTTEDDPRKTKFGSFIRKTSIDEFPQFFNILKGDMSLIGPRPERPVFVEEFREQIPKYMIKHYVRPGMTGWAQVNGWRGNTSIQKRIEHDIYYVENWSLLLDFKIFFLTFIKGFINRNAY